jgi:flagellar hook-associated protein 1 FlgK
MSLGDALAIAMAGLRANQAAMTLVSSNVANAETPGYVEKSTDQVTTNTGSTGSGVNVNGVNRQLDQYVQTQLRTETSGASYASLRSDYLQQLQSIYGDPNSTGTLENAFNGLTTAVQALGTSPDSQSARISVVNAAQSMAQQLNSMSQGIQTLRGAAENGINNDVNTANALMKEIADINNHVQSNPLGGTSTDAATASLLDQRDQDITQLSQLMDIKVATNSNNQVTISTGSGVELVGNQAATLSFNPQGTVTPTTTYSSNASQSALGAITVSYANGGSVNLTNTIKSGEIAAYVDLRDNTLVQAQNQLDQFAGSLSSALSDTTTVGTPTTVGTQTGYNVDLTGLQTGNTVNVTYTDTATNTQHTVSIVRVDDPSVLPLPNSTTADPNDKVVGIDFSQNPSTVLAQLNAALNGSNVRFTGTPAAPANPTSLNVLNSPNFSTINSASTTITQTSLTSGTPQLPLFTDNGTPFTGAVGATGSQQTGLAGRLTVNAGLVADPSRLVVYNTSPLTPSGDGTRANFITQQLTNATFLYSPQGGVGSASAPFKGTLLSYMQQFTSAQGAQAQTASQLSDGQNVVLSTLQAKFTTTSGVNIDEEMAHLLSLQNAYAANARVMSTVNQMYQTLMQAM